MSSAGRRIPILLSVGVVLGIFEPVGAEAPSSRVPDPLRPSTACFFSGGNWYDGKRFKRTSFWSVNGILTSEPQEDSTCRIDLGDRYLIPPLGEAHVHSLNDAAAIEEQIDLFMKKGVFYAMVQGAIFEIGPEIRSRINRPDTVDAIYAQGTMAAPWYGTRRISSRI